MPRALSAHELRSPVPTDAAVARSCPLLPVATVAAELGLAPDDFDTHGPSVAKLRLGLLDSLADREDGYYVVVGGITPTPLGEGKSTTTAGLSQARRRRADAALSALAPAQRARGCDASRRWRRSGVVVWKRGATVHTLGVRRLTQPPAHAGAGRAPGPPSGDVRAPAIARRVDRKELPPSSQSPSSECLLTGCWLRVTLLLTHLVRWCDDIGPTFGIKGGAAGGGYAQARGLPLAIVCASHQPEDWATRLRAWGGGPGNGAGRRM